MHVGLSSFVKKNSLKFFCQRLYSSMEQLLFDGSLYLTENEENLFFQARCDLAHLMQKYFNVLVQPFGSYVSQLAVTGISDLDIAVNFFDRNGEFESRTRDEVQGMLSDIFQKLQNDEEDKKMVTAGTCQLILSPNVPIIKFQMANKVFAELYLIN